MPSRRKRRLPLTVWRKLAVLETFFTPSAKRRTTRDRTDAMSLLVEYAGGSTPKAIPTESGRCYICTFPAKWVREAIPGLGFTRANKILLCGRQFLLAENGRNEYDDFGSISAASRRLRHAVREHKFVHAQELAGFATAYSFPFRCSRTSSSNSSRISDFAI
jgi:hypothetical protein